MTATPTAARVAALDLRLFLRAHAHPAAMSAVPLVMYKFAGSGYENWEHLAWAGALLVTLFVLAVSLVARALLLRNKIAPD